MLYAYIGAAAVVGLLIGFVALSIIWVSRTVGKTIRDRTLDLISSYDELLEERSRQLAVMEEEIDREETRAKARPSTPGPAVHTGRDGEGERPLAPSALLNAAKRMGTAAYQSEGFGELYEKIRRNFTLEPAKLLDSLPVGQGPREGGPAAKLLRELNVETLYRLSTLPGEEQYELLKSCIPEQLHQLLEDTRDKRGGFSCLVFYDALRTRAGEEPNPVRLYVAPEAVDAAYPTGVEVVADPEICEGLQIEVDNLLYDYSIKMGEIG